MTPTPALARLLPLALLALAAPLPPAGAAPGQEAPRVIVLGFDGADARTVAELMDQGQLPNLKALAEQGTFAPLSTTNPAESPVSWSSLNCGQNPAKTGIPGFVVRQHIGGGGQPFPGIGFFENREAVPLAEFEGAPLPAWSATTYAALTGLAVLVVFLLVLRLLLRLRPAPAIALALALGAVGAWGGWRLRSYMPEHLPHVANPLKTTPFWETAARAGVECVVLDAAQAWDREPVPGARVLAGLGVPDARGNYNGYTLYTADETWVASEPGPAASTPSAGLKLRVDVRDGAVDARVWGPANFWELDRLRLEAAELEARAGDPNTPFGEAVKLEERQAELTARMRALRDQPMSVPLRVELDGAEGIVVALDEHPQTVEVGRWSDWYPLTFDVNPLIKVRAITRAKVLQVEPHLELYLDTLQLDPANPPFWQPISQPADYSEELAARVGPFETVGWACMNLPYKDGLVDPITFLEDIEFTFRWREALTLDALARGDWRLFFGCLSTPDRVQHMMYQFYDPEHPMYDEAEASRTLTFFGEEIELRDAIPAIYRQVDRLVGDVVREHVRPGDALLLCADHGFQSFRRQVHLNNWLLEEGYLATKPGLSRASTQVPSTYVDWARTRAYSVGLGMIYLNLRGREAGGIVDPADAPALLEELRRDLLAYADPDSGEPIVRTASVTAQVHEGPYLDLEADLLLGFAPGYRVSWGTTSGGLALAEGDGGLRPGPSVVDNDKNWSGDHVSVDPAEVRGMFFANMPLAVPPDGADLRQVAPTVLALLGVPVPPEYDLPPLVPTP